MTDYGEPSQILSEHQVEIIAAQDRERLEIAGVNLEYDRGPLGLEARLRPGKRVGATRFTLRGDYVDVLVEPRVGNARFLRMLEVANSELLTHDEVTNVYESEDDLSSIVTEFVVDRILEFLRRYSYRDYHLRFDRGSTRPRGRLDVGSYVTRNMPRLKWDRMACFFFEFSGDVIENQVIATTLTVAARIVARLESTRKKIIAQKIAVARQALFGVTERPFAARDEASIVYHSRNSHFKLIHRYCFLLLLNSSVSLNPGRRIPFSSFALDMAVLYERYVRAIIGSIYGRDRFLPKSRLRFDVGNKGEIKLDGLICDLPTKTTVECKYKLVQDAVTGAIGEKAMADDIYQTVAYSVHNEVQATGALLIYPSTGFDAPAVHEVEEIRSFRGAHQIPIKVLMVNLSSSETDLRRGFEGVLRPQRLPEGFAAA